MDPVSIAFASLSLGGGVLIWTIRQEGRINAHDQLFAEREKQTDERYETLQENVQEMRADIKRLLDRPSPGYHN